MKKSVRIGLLGLGTVGTGVVRILETNRKLIEKRAGIPLEVVKIAVQNPTKERQISLPEGILTSDPFEVVADPSVDIVVELIGGYEPAKQLSLDTIERKKHLVTANKALLAEYGPEIRKEAKVKGVSLGFEASVAGGIPVIKTIREALAANHILSVYGVINGTSNYILTKMRDEKRSFQDVLLEAQNAGYAESDPTFDVEGIDSAHKLAILVNLAFGTPLKPNEIYTEGITEISPIDIEFGRECGYTLKLLGIAKTLHGELDVRVHPTLVPDGTPIAKVGGVYNAVEVVGDSVGDLMLFGRGAGAGPTASAVVSDIMDIARDIETSGRSALPSDIPKEEEITQVKPIASISSLYYLRFMVVDRPGVLSQISNQLSDNNISIESVIQKGWKTGNPIPLVIMTHKALERDVQLALQEINKLSCITEKPVLIRVEAEE